MRFAADTGGTFTDLIVESDDGVIRIYKASTVVSNPVSGVINALELAAADAGEELNKFLAKGEMLIHGTTHALNAIITGQTAKTAFLTTEGHADILVLREGGRIEPFNHTVPYPEPYVPRRYTFQIPERIDSAGRITKPLNEDAVIQVIERLKELQVEAVGVCFLWSILNSIHEARVAELLRQYLPGVKITLSHQLNPAIREYPRAISTCIDASLKPMMSRYMGSLESRLRDAGFKGRVLVLTSQAGMLDAARLSEIPIHSINSGPSAAPVAGRFYASKESKITDVIIADTGGTTYDVSLVRDGHIPFTSESWLGQPFRSDMTGFPSVDVKSVGAGGGSIAWLDDGGLLHVGPQSAGAVPGPACYANGGTLPTLTDACLVLGYIDPDYFLGGSMKLDRDASHAALHSIAEPLSMNVKDAAHSVVEVATENMVQAIADITINRGVDPKKACLIGGGGAAGLNSVLIARRLGCPMLLIPSTGAALSAAGALMTDLSSEYRRLLFTTSDNFDYLAVSKLLHEMECECLAFYEKYGKDILRKTIEFSVEARYPNQVWEIELPFSMSDLRDTDSTLNLEEAFHALHERIYAVADTESPIEFVTWIAKIRCVVSNSNKLYYQSSNNTKGTGKTRRAHFDGIDYSVDIYHMGAMTPGKSNKGPAIIESPFTSVVVPPDASFVLTENANLLINPLGDI